MRKLHGTNEQLGAVAQTLKAAYEHGLEAEVMYSALTMAAEANEHGLTMEQVLDAALGEWDI
tara:strand:+ start:63 stop:248 length:186 start_codon:yes stop_codon:yes gene_type:complete